ncbi:hypothetical protein [Fusibacter ferrireducens]|uniref:Uncharacterized protein n=1 Tax=Fusibacter ferrireducens TaxID=2785058 RepID=A0ABR9ZTT4_9FIRM|nr:hypothetical protein [Fusibacter ferrireducens]MBF4693894.1 hypothetical protein [Fusibacter ferrireducens]
MSMLTQFLNLFKVEPLVDGNMPFNITTMLNENWDKVDSTMKTLDEEVKDLATSASYLQEEEPTETNPSTVWYAIGSEANFNMGGGIVINNAETSETPPNSEIWFQTT